MSTTKKRLGMIAQQKREQLDLKRRPLAEACGLRSLQVQSVEEGKAAYTIDTLLAYLHELGLNLAVMERVGGEPRYYPLDRPVREVFTKTDKP